MNKFFSAVFDFVELLLARRRARKLEAQRRREARRVTRAQTRVRGTKGWA
jgi:hypothetical protein